MTDHPLADFPHAGFFRRIGAMIYDALIASAIFAIAHFLGFAITVGLVWIGAISLGEHADYAEYLNQSGIYKVYLGLCVCAFFIYFWSQGGQTLGMRAWRLRIQNEDGTCITVTQAIIRLATATFGIGNLLVLMDRKQKLALQDHMAHCVMVVLSKEANHYRNWVVEASDTKKTS